MRPFGSARWVLAVAAFVAVAVAIAACGGDGGDDGDGAATGANNCVYFSGFEAGPDAQGAEWEFTGRAVGIETEIVHSGDYALHVRARPRATDFAYSWLYDREGEITSYNTPWATFHLYVVSLPAEPRAIFEFQNQGSPFVSARLVLGPDGLLELQDSRASPLGQTTTALETERWHRVDVSMTRSPTEGQVEVRVDSQTEIQAQGVDTGSQPPNRVALGTVDSGEATYDVYFDDVYVDSQTWAPDGQASSPISAAASASFDDWSVLPEDAEKQAAVSLPVDDTTYLFDRNGTSRQTFTLGDPEEAGVGENVSCVAFLVRARVANGVTDNVSNVVIDGGEEEVAVAGAPTGFRWQRPMYLATRINGESWTVEALKSLEVGFSSTLNPGGENRVSALFVSVWHSP